MTAPLQKVCIDSWKHSIFYLDDTWMIGDQVRSKSGIYRTYSGLDHGFGSLHLGCIPNKGRSKANYNKTNIWERPRLGHTDMRLMAGKGKSCIGRMEKHEVIFMENAFDHTFWHSQLVRK
ncbi:MAG: hypothetical protein ACHQEM_03530 [Chitinophagales bacterium]